MSAAKQPSTRLRVGRLTKAHGLKGAIKLELYTDDPDARFVPGAVFSLQVPESSPWHGKTLTFAELRWYNGHPVGFFEGVNDRTTAESLIKAILWYDLDPSEQEPEEDAWYDHQLVGLDVRRDGVSVGTVIRVDHLPAQDLLIVKTEGGEVMVPFVSAIVPSVDIVAGAVTVTPPAGLFEEISDEAAAGDVTRVAGTGTAKGSDVASDESGRARAAHPSVEDAETTSKPGDAADV